LDKSFGARPHRIDVHFLEPIETAGLTTDDVPALKEQVFKTMWEHIEKSRSV
jgi:1-acyl-sn-glycerol-3-phosphate acyltransferase